MRSALWQCCCLLALVAWVPLAHAQTQVYRCVGAQGEPVFSGEPCGNPIAAPRQSAASALARNPFKGVCAASPTALKHALEAAFAGRDVNHLAGLILWRGMDTNSANATLTSLATWLQQPLAGVTFAYAAGPPRAVLEPTPAGAVPPSHPAAATSHSEPIGVEVATAGSGGNARYFGLTELAGCWWLTF